jgi:hypothetical protein
MDPELAEKHWKAHKLLHEEAELNRDANAE